MNSEASMWDLESDVIVVGGGAAGFAAALGAARNGSQVILLERSQHVGGTTAKSTGGYWIPNNHQLRERGIEESRPELLRYMARLAYPALFDPSSPSLGLPPGRFAMIEAYLDKAPAVVEGLAAIGALSPVPELNLPSYHADLEESPSPSGRTLMPSGIPARVEDGTGGDVLIAGMQRVAESLGVSVLVGHHVVELLRNDADEVVGVEVRTRRQTVLARARRGVVFATGGFLQNETLSREFLRGPVFGGCAADTCTGDFVRMGAAAGAQLGNMANAWWSQVVLEDALRSRATISTVWLPFGDSMIQVNRYGQRVVNEKMPYNERTQAHFWWNAAKREFSNLLLFMIWDAAVASNEGAGAYPSFRYPVQTDNAPTSVVISAATWPELVEAVDARLAELADRTGGVRLDPTFATGLAATVDRFNTFASTGEDLDFDRGRTPIQQVWGVAGCRPEAKSTMHPFAPQGPYHCAILAPGALDTKGGPVTDTSGRVLREDGTPIAGLFGAGNCVASPAGQAYWGAGGTIGPALVFGHLAGQAAAAASPTKDL